MDTYPSRVLRNNKTHSFWVCGRVTPWRVTREITHSASYCGRNNICQSFLRVPCQSATVLKPKTTHTKWEQDLLCGNIGGNAFRNVNSESSTCTQTKTKHRERKRKRDKTYVVCVCKLGQTMHIASGSVSCNLFAQPYLFFVLSHWDRLRNEERRPMRSWPENEIWWTCGVYTTLFNFFRTFHCHIIRAVHSNSHIITHYVRVCLSFDLLFLLFLFLFLFGKVTCNP